MKIQIPALKNTVKSGRRDFLKSIWKILGLMAAAELTFFTVSLLRPGRNNQNEKKEAALKMVGNVDDYKLNTVTIDRVNKLFLIRGTDGGFLALSLLCPHLGCSVLWDEIKEQFICPCHSSAFDKFGNVINAPAPRALDFFPVIVEAGKIKINTARKMKRKKFDISQLTYAQ
jgi:cytochrome b6-f complex iron-sulfur subunit